MLAKTCCYCWDFVIFVFNQPKENVMKSILIVLSVVIFLSACNSGNTPEKEKKFELRTTKTYVLKPELSKLSWIRQVDYKYLEKRMKIFGTYTNVSLENVQLETNGENTVKSGSFVVVNEKFTSAEVEIDLTLTRFYSDEEESFFESESYDPAKLVVNSFVEDSAENSGYIATADLTMNGKTQEINFPVSISYDANSNVIFTGTYLMQTSEWPILKQPKPENVNYDEISFGFDLVFGDASEKVDTVYVE